VTVFGLVPVTDKSLSWKYPEAKNDSYTHALVLEAGSKDLKTILIEKGQLLKLEEKFTFAVSVMEIVQELHSCGIAWMDIKPANFVKIVPTEM
jgi:serine/threonine protein kinase